MDLFFLNLLLVHLFKMKETFQIFGCDLFLLLGFKKLVENIMELSFQLLPLRMSNGVIHTIRSIDRSTVGCGIVSTIVGDVIIVLALV